MYHPYTIFPLGDSAVTVEFGKELDPEANDRAYGLSAWLRDHRLPGVHDFVMGYASLTICFDPVDVRLHGDRHRTAFEQVSDWIARAPAPESLLGGVRGSFHVPVCYGGEYGPDLEAVARFAGLSPEEVIDLHCQDKIYQVYMMGFLPGFAYLGTVDERIAMPRRPSPRKQVAAGSIGIAGRQTGIYPLDSPGGWQLIRRTPLRLFDPYQPKPSLLDPGVGVRFIPITPHEFADYQSGAAR